MQWERTSSYCETSAVGYKVSAAKVGEAWIFSAWSPPQMPELKYKGWLEKVGKVHYALGEPVPQRRRYLGRADTADAARRICEAHFEQQVQHDADDTSGERATCQGQGRIRADYQPLDSQ